MTLVGLTIGSVGCGKSGGGSGDPCEEAAVNLNGEYQDTVSSTRFDLEHDCETGDVIGTLHFNGAPLPLEGTVTGTDFEFETGPFGMCPGSFQERTGQTRANFPLVISDGGAQFDGNYTITDLICAENRRRVTNQGNRTYARQ